jgi:hypothetical protein
MTIDFGNYVKIEQHRFGVPNEMYLHKVIGRFESNTYVDVPVKWDRTEVIHDKSVPVVACICCGIDETEVRRYRLEDVQLVILPKDFAPMTISKQKLLQWVEDKKYVYSAPELDDSPEEIAKWSGCMKMLNMIERMVELGEFKQEEEVVDLCNLKLLGNS